MKDHTILAHIYVHPDDLGKVEGLTGHTFKEPLECPTFSDKAVCALCDEADPEIATIFKERAVPARIPFELVFDSFNDACGRLAFDGEHLANCVTITYNGNPAVEVMRTGQYDHETQTMARDFWQVSESVRTAIDSRA